MNDALEMILLMRETATSRMSRSRPTRRSSRCGRRRVPTRRRRSRQATLERWPGAHVRYHLRYQLAEMAAERGDHATAAITHALAVADTSSKSRLAPAAL